MKIFVTYEDDNMSTMSTIEVDVDTGKIFVAGILRDDLEARLLMKLVNVTLRLYDIYEDFQKEKEKEK